MVRIQKHGANGELFDLNAFLADLDTLCPAEEWEVSVGECLGDGAAEVESFGFSKPSLVTTEHLRTLYRNVYQTIDGEFIGYRGGKEHCRFVAVDSSYWEIVGPPDFEAAFALKYGLYVPRRI